MYQSSFLLSIKGRSFIKFVESGKSESIRVRVFQFLRENPNQAYTQSELASKLNLKVKSSICYACNNLVKLGLICVSEIHYDDYTAREVGAYQFIGNEEVR